MFIYIGGKNEKEEGKKDHNIGKNIWKFQNKKTQIKKFKSKKEKKGVVWTS